MEITNTDAVAFARVEPSAVPASRISRVRGAGHGPAFVNGGLVVRALRPVGPADGGELCPQAGSGIEIDAFRPQVDRAVVSTFVQSDSTAPGSHTWSPPV